MIQDKEARPSVTYQDRLELTKHVLKEADGDLLFARLGSEYKGFMARLTVDEQREAIAVMKHFAESGAVRTLRWLDRKGFVRYGGGQ